MGVTTITQEFPIPQLPLANPPPLERPQNKTFTHGVKSIELVEGQWDVPDSIFKVTYTDGSAGYEKYKIVVADHSNKCYKNTLVEGGLVGDKVESADLEIAFMGESSNPVMKITSSYHTKDDLKLTEEEICGEKNKAMVICQAMVAQFSTPTNAT